MRIFFTFASSRLNSTLSTYDPLGRLIQGQTRNLTAANTWNLLWNYDIYGNRESQSAGTPAGTLTTGAPQLDIDPATNRISQSSGFTYDPAGNVTKDPSYTYTYNGEGELLQSVRSSDGMTASYAYDGHRWRMEKTAAGATTVYIYSGSKVLAEYAAGAAPNAPSKEYVYSGGSLLATLAGTNVTYHYPDHLSNRFETNSAGTVTRTFGHLPFGETWYETGAADKWKFTGYERDTTESGLDYAMNRMYSNGYGRFQTADLLHGTSDNPQTLNRYSYVSNDATNAIDPTGLNQVKLSAIPPEDWSCTLNGIATPCSLVQSVIGADAGVQCPDNFCSGVSSDGTLVQFYAFAGGTTGYFNPSDIAQGVNEWNGALYNDANWQKLLDQRIDDVRWSLAAAIAAVTGQKPGDVYANLKYVKTTGSNADFSFSGDLSFLLEFPQDRFPGSPSIHLSHDLVHLDTADPFPLLPPFGLLDHFFFDVLLGHINPGVPMAH